MGLRYANAKDVLPGRLVREIQKHWNGLLWIPAPFVRQIKTKGDATRNRRIYRQWRRGVAIQELAYRHRLSRVQIWRIVRKQGALNSERNDSGDEAGRQFS